MKLISGAFDPAAKDNSIGCAEALRRAMLVMIEHNDMKDTEPAHCAPFVVVGEGEAARESSVKRFAISTPDRLAISTPSVRPLMSG